MKKTHLTLSLAFLALLQACGSVPDTIEPVTDFDLERYMGKWYEIARLDHRFERGLQEVTANYTLNGDGTVTVLNRGFATDEEAWQEAIGKARFAGETSAGALEVSFFGPFYAPYVIFEIDAQQYQWAYVTSSKNALWLLARSPQVGQERIEAFKAAASAAGYDTSELIFVSHGQSSPPTSTAGSSAP